ncbi:MAG: hypothetical protein FJ398_17015 [Verrucomicrobia bacterium]|nr:hypothetical protein [Verrucomicrobiota bacterium]
MDDGRNGMKNAALSHEPDGRASLSPASRILRVPGTSSGSPGRTRPTGLMGREQGNQYREAFHELLGTRSTASCPKRG